jgi:hypothetical protein
VRGLFLVAALAGCGAGNATDGGSLDAASAPQDFTTLDLTLPFQPCSLPAQIADPIVFTARVVLPPMLFPIAGAVVDFRLRSDDSLVGTSTADAGGKISLSLPSNGKPIDGYFKISANGYVTEYLYPPTPGLAAGANNFPLLIYQDSFFSDLAQSVGVNVDPSAGIIEASVQDCTRAPVENAVVAIAPPSGKLVYGDGNGHFIESGHTSSDGLALAFNVAPGEVTLSATALGQLFAPMQPKSWPGGYTIVRGPHP